MQGLLYSAFASVALPVYVLAGLHRRGWLQSLPERFMGGGWRALARPGARRIWLHAASGGELSGLIPLARELAVRGRLSPSLITVTSPAARERAREDGAADDVCFLPVDHPAFLRRAFDRVEPRVLVIAETEIWPGLLLEASRRGIPVVLVNARISDRSLPRYRRFRPLLAPLLAHATVLAQSGADRERFLAIGARAGRVHVAGSTKYEGAGAEISREARSMQMAELGLDAEKLCMVAGSVHPGEDEIAIGAFARALAQHPLLQLVIAPRHAERFEAVARLLEKSGLHYRRRSAKASRGSADHPQVVLLDSLGELAQVYRLAGIAFVGGSLVPIGGHNPLEPAAYCVPLLMGPHTGNVRAAVDALKKQGALFEVGDEDALVDAILRLARDPELRAASGDAGLAVCRANAGVTSRIADWIERLEREAQAG